MKFSKISPRIASSIGDVRVTIRERSSGEISASFEIEVVDQDGATLATKRGDLLEVADAASQKTLAAELASLRKKATGLLPE